MSERMPVLAVHQPWASLLVSGDKDFENRNWKLSEKFLGKKILIHATKKKDQVEWDYADSCYSVYTRQRESLQPLDSDCYKFGGIIGWVIFDKVVEYSDSIWFDGKFGFHVKEYQQTEFFPVKGHQKIFYINLPEDSKL